MKTLGSITQLAKQLEAGDEQAVGPIWDAYAVKLLSLIRAKLDRRLHRRVDEHDVVQSAFCAFWLAAKDGRYPVENRTDLWNLLFTITIRKVLNAAKRHSRGGRDYRREADIQGNDGEEFEILKNIAANDPEPDHAVIFAEELERLLGVLSKEELPKIVRMKFDGMTNAEIAMTMKCTERTIERKLDRIRKDWVAACEPE